MILVLAITGFATNDLLDRNFKRTGYAVVEVGARPRPPLSQSNELTDVELDVKVRNHWGLVRAKGESSVFRAEAPPHGTVFFVMKANAAGTAPEEFVIPNIINDKELLKAGGVEMSVREFVATFDLKENEIAPIYLMRRFRIRADRKRVGQPYRILRSLLEVPELKLGRPKTGREVEFTPVSFRKTAVASLKAEIELTRNTPSSDFRGTSEDYDPKTEKMRRLVLAIEGHLAADDGSLNGLYLNRAASDVRVRANDLRRNYPDLVESYVRDWLRGFGKDQEMRTVFLENTDLQSSPWINLASNGTGRLMFRTVKKKGWAIF